MKKRLCMVMAMMIFSTSLLAGCGKGSSSDTSSKAESETSTEDAVWDRIESSGKIVLGSSGTYSPYTYFDDDGNITGFDIELTNKVAEKLGVEVEYVQTKWDSLIAGVQTDRLDIVANQVGITDERKEAVDFSDPYCAIYPALLVKEDSDITSFEDLDGKSICCNLTTVFAPLAEKYGASTVSSEGQMTNEISMVEAGRVDGTIDDNITLQTYLNENPDCGLKIVAIDESQPTYIGFMIKKGSTVLEEKVNDAIAELEEEGVIKELGEKFVGMDISVK
nr:transporter substrate-binding domain-containing protein [uncultured Mediterraneibacter sp.]